MGKRRKPRGRDRREPASDAATPRRRDPSAGRGNAAAQERLRQARGQGSKWNDAAGTAVKATGFGTDLGLKGLAAGLGRTGAGLPEQLAGGLDAAGKVAGSTFGFFGHLLGDEQVADSGVGHAANAVAKTAAEFGWGEMLGQLPQPVLDARAARLAGGAGVLAAADDFLGVENPAKFATATAAELVPASQGGKLLGGGVDALTAAGQAITGDHAAAFRSAEIVENNAVNGGYGAVAQAATLLTALAAGDQEVVDKSVDREAETGQRGFFAAWGNAAGDLWADATGQPDARGGRYVNLEEYTKELHEMAWYKPWTW